MERENRKVLISVKVSTLLLILVSIIGIIVLTNIIKDNIQKNKELANQTTYEENIVNEETNSQRVIKVDLSSRGTTTEKRENHDNLTESIEQTDNNENVESEVQEEITDDTVSNITLDSNILYGTVGGINFDTSSIENSIENDFITEEEYISIEEVTISKDMDLTIRTGLSREDFITLISGVKEDKSGFFEENAGLIYDICKEYQINEIFFCGLIAGESGWNIADNHRRTYNYISLMSSKGLIKFSSVEDGLRKAAEALHENYLTEGGRFYHGKTLAGVKTKFCPASSTWTTLIYGNMKKIVK